jgi:hypothetical protein
MMGWVFFVVFGVPVPQKQQKTPFTTMPNIAIDRLYSQQIACSKLKTPAEVVSWLVAVQAQDYPGAKWSLGLRLPGSHQTDIEQALAEKSILRTWMVRGTLHFVTATDIRWMLSLLAPRLIAGSMRRYKELELDEPTLAHSNTILAKALQNGEQLTRTELFTILERNGLAARAQRGIFMLQRASLDGLICQSVMRGRDPVFLALDDSIPPTKTMTKDEALAELAQRYFTSRGPATLQDFGWWGGLLATDAKAGLEAVKSQFVQEIREGQTYWHRASEPKIPAGLARLYLLPGFDEYLLGYKDRTASLTEPRYKKLTPLNGMFPATIVIDGQVVGTWNRTLAKHSVTILPNPFTELTPGDYQDLAVAAQRYGQFLGISARYLAN